MIRVAFRQAQDLSLSAIVIIVLFLAGCTTVAQVTTLSDPNCRHSFVDGMTQILVEEGEKQETADRLAEAAVTTLANGALGPRPFLVSSPSGADYGFFIQKKSPECFLQLVSRQKGFVRYRNNLTYIATRQLEGCQCGE